MDIETLEELSITLDKVAVFLINGIITDGAHHKQYFLARALRDLCGEVFTDKSQVEFEWDSGIAP